MATIGAYLMSDHANASAPPGADVDAAASSAIKILGATGPAPIAVIATQTGYETEFLQPVLAGLQQDGLIESDAEQNYRLTEFGAKAQYFIAS